MKSDLFHLVIYCPQEAASAVRTAAASAGAGQIGHYDSCSFSSKGTGRFRPLDGATPAIGAIGEIEEVNEERIELVCEREKLSTVLQAITSVHPYEEPAIHVLPMCDYKEYL